MADRPEVGNRAYVVPVRFAAGTHVVQATTGALSAECAFVRCLVPPRPGERISLRLYLPGAPPLRLSAKVRARTGREAGMGFWADFAPEPSASRRIVEALGLVERAGRPIDRRATARYSTRFAVRFGTVDEFKREYATNISSGGLFIRTEAPPEMNSVIDVVLELPGGKPVEAKAMVVHRVTAHEAARLNLEPGAGVQFVEGDDRFRERIDKFVAQLAGD
ncbi:MAG TPA: TIGR02266 family protein [Myxococcales bacterium]|nr:TIGR02266 family protein [Myxococcales bacterium]